MCRTSEPSINDFFPSSPRPDRSSSLSGAPLSRNRVVCTIITWWLVRRLRPRHTRGPMAGMKKKISHTHAQCLKLLKPLPPPSRKTCSFGRVGIRGSWHCLVRHAFLQLLFRHVFLKHWGLRKNQTLVLSFLFFLSLLCTLQQRCRCKTRQVYDISTCFCYSHAQLHTEEFPPFFFFFV